MSAESPAPPRVIREPDVKNDVSIMVSEMEGWFNLLKKSHVGYNTLTGAHQGAIGATPDGVRKKGLPIFGAAGAGVSFAPVDHNPFLQ